jgi:histidyl-tRNA synthetase
MALSNQPPKGTADWFPEEFQIRKYIFDTWRRVCVAYGYQEYLTPLVESAEIYRAKSGDDIGGKELMSFVDQAGRELSIRPEMTPSVTRLVSQIYDSAPKPIRYFSIANFMRNEKPQRGRNREFWQLNVDIFGNKSETAELEMLQMALDIVLSFRPPQYAFILCLNHRQLIDAAVAVISPEPSRNKAIIGLMDKWQKMSWMDFSAALTELGVDESGLDKLQSFLSARSIKELVEAWPELADNEGLIAIKKVMVDLELLGYGEYLEFKPSIIRGFDYYDGLVFEMFDNHPDNKRAMFGGGRYNGLAGIFGAKSFPAVGFAPGDETTKLFLESWGLLEQIKQEVKADKYYLPLLANNLKLKTMRLAQSLRQSGKVVEVGLEEQKLGKALEYANKSGAEKMVIFGQYEDEMGLYKIKEMRGGVEQECKWKNN